MASGYFRSRAEASWMEADGYDIEAKAEGNPPRAQIMLMLQTLLEEVQAEAAPRDPRVPGLCADCGEERNQSDAAEGE